MAKPRRARRTKTQWRAVIDEQANSGMAVTDYCDVHDIPVASFRRWQRTLVGSKETNSAQFIELPDTPVSEVASSVTQRIELDLGHGITLRVYS